jgi:hypothetical protein
VTPAATPTPETAAAAEAGAKAAVAPALGAGPAAPADGALLLPTEATAVDPAGLVVFGTGGHARKVAQAARLAGWAVVAFADERVGACSPWPDVPVLDAAAWAALPAGRCVAVAIGAPAVRERLMVDCLARGLRLPVIVHPRAVVDPEARLGAGAVVAAGAVIEAGCRVGAGAIVDIGVLLDHDATVAPYTHLRPGTVCPPASHWPAPA